MIRHTITTPKPEPVEDPDEALMLEDVYNAAVNDELIAAARATGLGVVLMEVAYPGDDAPHPEGGTVWDHSGDALEIDLTGDEPQIRTLSTYEWNDAR